MKEYFTAEHFLISCELVDRIEVWPPFTGGVDLATIKIEEKKLGLPITGSYLEFIKRYGAQESQGFDGIDLKWGGTVSNQSSKFWARGLPSSHILVFFADMTCFSLNTDEQTSPGEFAAYQFRWGKPCHSFNLVADSFAELWVDYFQIKKEVRKAYKKKHG